MSNFKNRRSLSSNILNPAAPKSAMEISKQTKELIEANEQALMNPVVKPIAKCGLSNPCNFGTPNKKFNKNVLNKLG